MKKEGLHNDHKHFGLPEDYFARFDERLMAEIRLRELMPSDEGFRVPENYFAQSGQALLDLDKAPKIFEFRSRTVTAILAIAAAVILALLVVQPQRMGEPSFEELSLNTLDAYLSQDNVTEYLLDEDADFLENTSLLETTSLDEEAVIQYLESYPLDDDFIND